MKRRDFIHLSGALSAAPLLPSFSFSQETLNNHDTTSLVCDFCSVGCSGSTKDQFCIKGYASKLVNSENRIKTPLLRMKDGVFDKNGKLTPVTWDKAFSVMAKHLKRAINHKGPNGVALFSSGNLGVLETYSLQKLFRVGFRSNNIYNSNHFNLYANMISNFQVFGTNGVFGNFEDIDHSDVVVNWGANLAETYPVLFGKVLKKLDDKDFKFVNISPFKNRTSNFATLNLTIQPNSDIYILKFLLNNFLQNNESLIDWEMIKRRFIFATINQFQFTKTDQCEQWEISYNSFKQSLKPYTLEYITPFVKTSSETKEDFEKKLLTLSDYFNNDKIDLSSFWSAGINKQKNSIELNTLLYSIHLLCNKHSRAGCAMISLSGQSNSVISSILGVFGHRLPGDMFIKYKEHRQKAESIWNVPDGTINPSASNDQFSVFENIKKQQTKFMWAMGSNPYKSTPNLLEHIKNFENNKESFLVTSDYFMSETAMMSDLVLPTAMGYEKEYISCNNNKELSFHQQSMIPYGKSMSELWQIIEFSKYIKLHHVWDINKIDDTLLLESVLPKLTTYFYEPTDSLCDLLFLNRTAKKYRLSSNKTYNTEVKGDHRDIITKDGLLFFGFKSYIQKYLYDEMCQFFRGVGYDMPSFELLQAHKIKWPYIFNKEIAYRFNPIDDIYAKKGSKAIDNYIFYGVMGGKTISFGDLKQITSKEKEELKFRAKIFTTTNPDQYYHNRNKFYLHEIKLLEHFNTGTITNNIEILFETMKQSFCYMAKQDMEKLQLKNQDLIEIKNSNATFYIRAMYDKRFDLEPNQIAIGNFGNNINLNTILNNVKDSFVSIKKYGVV